MGNLTAKATEKSKDQNNNDNSPNVHNCSTSCFKSSDIYKLDGAWDFSHSHKEALLSILHTYHLEDTIIIFSSYLTHRSHYRQYIRNAFRPSQECFLSFCVHFAHRQKTSHPLFSPDRKFAQFNIF